MDKVVVAEKFERIAEFWSPRIVGELNGQQVRLVKLRDRDVAVNPGEFIIVPRWVEHKPCAPEEAHVMLFEPASTLNTGNVRSERTVENPERL